MSEMQPSKRTYLCVWAILMVLLGISVAFARVQLGQFNVFIALTIAGGKAIIIALYFMHVRYSSRLIWIFAGAGVLWLSILFSLSITEYMGRSLLPVPTIWQP